ncbi:MAG: hypothetical protein WBO69_09015 [Thermoanaerobaculia bacterium]
MADMIADGVAKGVTENSSLLMIRQQIDRVLLVTLTVAYLSPVWFLDFFATQDGPAHVDSVNVLLRVDDKNAETLRVHYDSSFRAVPNWTAQLLMAGLAFSAGPVQSEKLFLTLYVLLFVSAVLLLQKAVGENTGFLCLLGFPLVFPWHLNKGFYSYSLGVALCILLLGWWIQFREKLTWRRATLLAGALVLLYFTHAAALGATLILLTTTSVFEILIDRSRWKPNSQASRSPHTPPPLKELGFLAACFAPALSILLLFVSNSEASDAGFLQSPLQLWRLKALMLRYPLVSYSKAESILAPVFLIFLVILGAVAIYKRFGTRSLHAGDSLLAGALLLSMLCLIVPNSLGGGKYLFERLLVFPLLLFTGWLSTVDWTRDQQVLIRTAGVSFSVLFLCFLTLAKINHQSYIREFLSVGEQLSRDDRFLTLILSPELPPDPQSGFRSRIQPFLHLAGYLSSETQAIDLSNYQGWTHSFPLLWRPSANPFYPLPILQEEGAARLLEYLRLRDLDTLDFLLVWSITSGGEGEDLWKSVEGVLDARFTRVMASEPNGWARLYQRIPVEFDHLIGSKDPHSK